MEKRSQKGSQKEWKKGAPERGFHTYLFFPFPPELQVGPRFLWCSTLFVLLIQKGGKKKRMAKRVKKGVKRGVKKGGCEQP
jgi:hypothetical protein